MVLLMLLALSSCSKTELDGFSMSETIEVNKNLPIKGDHFKTDDPFDDVDVTDDDDDDEEEEEDRE